MISVLKAAIKSAVQAVSLVLMFPLALLTAFGRIGPLFQFFAHAVALVPALPGDYLRAAYYAMTLTCCSLYSRISFGSFFAQSASKVGRGVYIGAYCVIGSCEIGERTQIASHVQIISGRYQHARSADGKIEGAVEAEFQPVSIGADCWIGASALVMADVGSGTTIGAGAVVTRPIPSGVVAVGNPARVANAVHA